MNVFADFDRRMARACKDEKARAVAAGDKQAFARAQAELENYGKMLAEDVRQCGCGWNCPALSDKHSPDAPLPLI